MILKDLPFLAASIMSGFTSSAPVTMVTTTLEFKKHDDYLSFVTLMVTFNFTVFYAITCIIYFSVLIRKNVEFI